MKVFLLPEPLGNAIMKYLGTKPFNEVVGLITGLDQLKEAPPAPLSAVPKKEGESG